MRARPRQLLITAIAILATMLAVMAIDPDEIETTAEVSADQTEYVVRIKGQRKLSTAEVVLELEMHISDMARADDQVNQPGVQRH